MRVATFDAAKWISADPVPAKRGSPSPAAVIFQTGSLIFQVRMHQPPKSRRVTRPRRGGCRRQRGGVYGSRSDASGPVEPTVKQGVQWRSQVAQFAMQQITDGERTRRNMKPQSDLHKSGCACPETTPRVPTQSSCTSASSVHATRPTC